MGARARSLMTLWVFLLLWAGLGSGFTPPTPLVCTQRADAVAVIAAACQLSVACRFELGTGNNALTLGTWDVLLTSQTHLLTTNPAVPDPQDTRYEFLPPQYVILPLLVYNSTSMLAVDCSVIANNPQTNLTAAVFDVLYALGQYLQYVSQHLPCADINEIPVWDNSTGNATVVCLCAPGKICTLGNTEQEALINVVAIMTIVATLVILLFLLITLPILMRQAARLEALRPTTTTRTSRGGYDDMEIAMESVRTVELTAAAAGQVFHGNARRPTNNKNNNNQAVSPALALLLPEFAL